MSVFIAIGSNLGDKKENLKICRNLLESFFEVLGTSRVYQSSAVDYLKQPDFYNQVIEIKTPAEKPLDVLDICLSIEALMGRERIIKKGPRIIDIDLIFWDLISFDSEKLSLPHPRAFQRSFVILPLSELKGFNHLKKHYQFTFEFDNQATPIS